MTENKRFKAHIFDDGVNERYHDGIIDNENDENVIRNYQYISMLLNELNDENKKLKSRLEIYNEYIEDLEERNDRQSETIRELYTLIENKDWETLTAHIEELNKAEEQLKIEMECYE